ncbi:MAG: YHS domain-containing protein [Candidatus Tectimicrobiota bacterium]
MVEKLSKDPVCGMRMRPDEAQYSSEYQGVVYYFCSEACQAKFDQQPSRFVPRPA